MCRSSLEIESFHCVKCTRETQHLADPTTLEFVPAQVLQSIGNLKEDFINNPLLRENISLDAVFKALTSFHSELAKNGQKIGLTAREYREKLAEE